MKKTGMILFAMLLLTFVPAVWAQGHDHSAHKHGAHDHAKHVVAPSAFDEILGHYEQIRLSLLNDSVKGVAQHAKAIERRVGRLVSAFDAADAGVKADAAGPVKTLLPELRKRAAQLVLATDLGEARVAFGELSKPLVRYREAVSGDRPVVAYCSMVKRSWLQPKGEIGNPYGGQQMPHCGEIVSN